MKLDLFSLIVLLGALQALIFGIFLLFAKATGKLQQRSLAAFILILSYNGFETLGWSAGWPYYSDFFNLFPFVLIFGIGPSLYLYVRSFQTASPVQKPYLHYLILMFIFLVRVSMLVVWYWFPERLYWLQLAGDWYGFVLEPLSMLWFCIYVILAIRTYRQLMPANVENGTWVPEEAGMIMRWLKLLLIFCSIIALTWFFTLLLPYLVDLRDTEPYYVIEVVLVLFIYWIGFSGYFRTRVIYIAQQQKNRSYFDSLDGQEVARVQERLEKAMRDDQLYLDPELNITSLAARLDIPAKTISAVLNQRLGKGFNEYVNAFRVDAFKRRILDPANKHLTMTGLAFECGFNSQPTFQRAFKAETGMTPKQFQAQN